MDSNGWNHQKARELQKRDGRTTDWLAEYCGVESPQQMNHYLSGRRKPKLPVIKLLAQAFDVTVEALMNVDEKKRPAPRRSAVAV